jgi:hypothetical protein
MGKTLNSLLLGGMKKKQKRISFMSTSIPGYLIHTNNVFAFQKKVNEIFTPLLKRANLELLLEEAILDYDLWNFGKGRWRNVSGIEKSLSAHRLPVQGDLRNLLLCKILDQSLDIQSREYQDWSKDFKITFLHDFETGKLYCLPVGSREFIKLFESLPEVSEYAYWNNSDHPDGITDEEWDERKEVWNRLAPRNDSLETNSLKMKVLSDFDHSISLKKYDVDELTPPTVEYRVHKLASKYLEGEYIAKFGEEKIFSHIGDFATYIGDSERQAPVAIAIAEQIEKDISDWATARKLIAGI